VIQAIGFDFDHTLGLDNKLERVVAIELGRNIASAARADFTDPDGSAFDGYIARYRNGSISLEEALAGYFQGFAGATEGAGSEFAEIVAEFKKVALSRAPEFVRPVPGATELLAQLEERGVPHAILTNGWSPLQEEKARLVGFKGAVLVSDLIGARKPSPEAFRVLGAALECAPSQIAYVGDDPRVDAGGALAAGMAAVWFDWEGRDYPGDLPPPTYRIGALSELASLVQGPLVRAANPAP
jgi:HAD superfamily hydrolase (TIGR01549 family)